ncbi:F-box and WD-40 domain-containing protein CDC4 [Cryptococcus gattii NT-10]|nr:F-box and WD-40 domain-containing protein CDC4 [Cryptococcus gattii NT-10]
MAPPATRYTPSSPPPDLPPELGVPLSPPATSPPPPLPPGEMLSPPARMGIGVHPPTPAPSPDPHRNACRSDQAHLEQPIYTLPTPQSILAHYTALPPLLRSKFLSLLIPHLTLHEALSLSRKIEPLLRRDFLRELPWEVALHVLSFAISRYWNTLLQDETTWRDFLLARHRIGISLSHRNDQPQSRITFRDAGGITGEEEAKGWDVGSSGLGPPADPNATNNTNTKWGTLRRRENTLGIGTGNQACCIKRVTPFGLEKRVLNLSSGLTGLPPQSHPYPSTPSTPSAPSAAAADAPPPRPPPLYSYKTRVKLAYLTETNWLTAGVLLAKHLSADDSVVTTLSFDESWIVVGMANSKIHVFSAVNGAWKRSLEGRAGHTQGVWAMVLVSPMVNSMQTQGKGRERRGPGYGAQASASASPNGWFGFNLPFTHPHHETPSPTPAPAQAYTQDEHEQSGKPAEEDETETEGGNLCGSVRGWQGLKTSLVVSGGCDKQVKVWDLETGQCIHSLPGHTSTIRCIKVLPHRPIAVSGSRDYTLRVWDIQRGKCLHTLRGHTKSVRCVEVWGNMAVSGSYDNTAKLWNLDTGECLQTFTGHYSQIYSIAFNGSLVITGSLDSTVRVWSPTTGECLALLQGHTALVGQLQLSGTTLVTGGSDGRVILFDLSSMSCIHRLCAHDNSVTCLQFDKRFIVSGGNDGRVKLWDVKTGEFVRELTKPCDAVWRTSFRGERIVVLCQREGRTCLEIVSFRPGEGERRATGR